MIADQPARRDVRDDAGLAAGAGAHLGELALALAELVDDDAGEFLVDVDRHLLDRLQPLAALLAEEHARPRDRQLEALAAHVLDQHAHLQLAAAGDLEGLAAGGVADLDRDVRLGLAHQPLADDPALHLVAVAAGQRASR